MNIQDLIDRLDASDKETVKLLGIKRHKAFELHCNSCKSMVACDILQSSPNEIAYRCSKCRRSLGRITGYAGKTFHGP